MNRPTFFQIFAVLAASVLAADFKCYLCDDEGTTDVIETCADDWDPAKSFLQQCSDSNGQHCFTYQRNYNDGTTVYQRGCQKKAEFAGFKEGQLFFYLSQIKLISRQKLNPYSGCLTTEDGTACYLACSSESCNLDYDLESIIIPPSNDNCTDTSSATTLHGSLALLMAYLFAQ